MNRFGRSSRKPFVPLHQLRSRWRTRGQVANARRADAGVLDEQDAMPVRPPAST